MLYNRRFRTHVEVLIGENFPVMQDNAGYHAAAIYEKVAMCTTNWPASKPDFNPLSMFSHSHCAHNNASNKNSNFTRMEQVSATLIRSIRNRLKPVIWMLKEKKIMLQLVLL